MKRISIFLAITFILTWAYEFGVVYPISSGALVGVPPVAAQFATGAAMFFPALGVLITRLVTREGFKNSLIKPRGFKKSLPWFAVAWFGPALLAVIGAAVYFLAFPQDFDPSMSTIVTMQQQAAAAAGAGDVSADQVRAMLLAQLPFAVLIAPALNIFTTFGEEWGWRGYLVPKMATHTRIVPTLLVTGVIWGLWHAPLTIIGHNYGVGYPGWPFVGIAAMCVFCIVLGIFLTYVTVRTGSCLAAAVGHGAINGFVSRGPHAVGYAPPRESRHPRYAAGGPARRHDESRPRLARQRIIARKTRFSHLRRVFRAMMGRARLRSLRSRMFRS